MKPNERVRAVYQGRKPDQVPLCLDLSHWYKKNRNVPFNLAGLAGVDCVKRWLDTRLASPRLIMAAGDQVPTDAPFHRIAMLPELVEKYGKY